MIVLCSESLVYPTDTIKRKMMMKAGTLLPKYKNFVHCAKMI